MAEKKEGRVNPYYRGHESEYDAGNQQIMSPVGSVFSHGYLRKDGSNAMEDALKKLDGPSNKVVSKQRGK